MIINNINVEGEFSKGEKRDDFDCWMSQGRQVYVVPSLLINGNHRWVI